MKYEIARLKREFSDEQVAIMEVVINTALIERVGLVNPDDLPKDFKVIWRESIFKNEECIQMEICLGDDRLRGIIVIDHAAKTIECRSDSLCIVKSEQRPRKQTQRWGGVQRIRKEDLFN